VERSPGKNPARQPWVVFLFHSDNKLASRWHDMKCWHDMKPGTWGFLPV
jgi:hypothetical protein